MRYWALINSLILLFILIGCAADIDSNQIAPIGRELRAIEISPQVGTVFNKGERFQIKATAVFSDEKRHDVTNIVTWETGQFGSTAGAIARLVDSDDSKEIDTLSSGQIVLKASMFGVRAVTTFTIKDNDSPSLASPIDSIVNTITGLIADTGSVLATFEMPPETLSEGETQVDPSILDSLPEETPSSENTTLAAVELPVSDSTPQLPSEEPEKETILLSTPTETAEEATSPSPSPDAIVSEGEEVEEEIEISAVSYSSETMDQEEETLFVISGYGFDDDAEVTVNSKKCELVKVVPPKSKEKKNGKNPRILQKIVCKIKKKHNPKEKCLVHVSHGNKHKT